MKGAMQMKKQAFNPYLSSWEYIPDGVNALYLVYRGGGNPQLRCITFIR